jgi:hypothetical protein
MQFFDRVCNGKKHTLQEIGDLAWIFSFGVRRNGAHLQVPVVEFINFMTFMKGTLPLRIDEYFDGLRRFGCWMDEHTEGSLSLIVVIGVLLRSHGLTQRRLIAKF